MLLNRKAWLHLCDRDQASDDYIHKNNLRSRIQMFLHIYREAWVDHFHGPLWETTPNIVPIY